MGALWEEPGGWAPLLGILKGMERKALEMGIFLHTGPTRGTREGTLLCWGLWEKGEILIYQEALFIGESKTYKKKALETGISLHRGPIVEPGGGFIYWGLWETLKECLINAVSLSLSLSIRGLWGEQRGRAPLLGTQKLGLISTQKQAWKLILGLSLSVKTRLLSFNRTQSRVVTGLFTGHNNLRKYIYLIRLTNSPLCRRCGTEEETSELILCECKALASLRHTYLGSFSWTQRMLGLSTSGGHLELQWRNKVPMTWYQIMEA